MYQYLFEPKAQNEYEESFNWYAQRSRRAALNFIEGVERALLLITEQPYQYKNPYKNYHEINLKDYPFTMVYTIEETLKTVIIYSIHHSKRHPKKKYKRINSPKK